MNKGLTLVEIIISFSIALILISSMYLIIYSNLKVSETNQYYIDANNILTFLSREIQNNPSIYIEYNPNENAFSYKEEKDVIIKMLKGKLRMYRYTINGSSNYNISLSEEIKIIMDNVVQVDITLSWTVNNKTYRTKSSVIISTFEIFQQPPINLPEDSDIEI
ncbi:MAG: hypothetical protein RMJ51_00585 [Candidatus Calescibacterium sp.]|nr:hypothetical protein [Candidatus Calescibacterium sp.]MDW8194730.1 hypothetical protein [Candidatus Calescibacterium sp.]